MSTPLSAPPITYQQALELATAANAATRAPKPAAEHARTVTAASAEATIAARDRASAHAKQAISKLWSTVNPYSDSDVAAFAAQAARILAAAQSAAARVAAVSQTQQLASMGVKASSAQSVPVDVRAKSAKVVNGKLVLHRPDVRVDYAGADGTTKITAEDMSTLSLFQRPAETYRWVVSQGGTDANEQSVIRIAALIDDNLMLAQRLAQLQVIDRAGRSSKVVTGYRRVIHPELSRGGTCGMCIAASDRLYKVSELMPIHAHCKCTIAAVTEDHDPADDLNTVDLNQLYKDSGGTSGAHLKRTRYRVDEHGELGPVLVPKKAFKPRSEKSRKRAGGTGVTGKPESTADVAARHLPGLRKSLADLKRRGLADDSSQVTYHKDQIAKFERELAAA